MKRVVQQTTAGLSHKKEKRKKRDEKTVSFLLELHYYPSERKREQEREKKEARVRNVEHN